MRGMGHGPWDYASVMSTLYRTQAQHLCCFFHDSIWFIRSDTIIWLPNSSLNGERDNWKLIQFVWGWPTSYNKNLFKKHWALVVAQLVERLLPIPEVRSLNPVIGKNLYSTFLADCIEKTKKEGTFNVVKCSEQSYLVLFNVANMVKKKFTENTNISRLKQVANKHIKVHVPLTKKHILGSGCGSVGRAVTFDTRGQRFDYSHRENFIEHFLLTCLLSTVLKRRK